MNPFKSTALSLILLVCLIGPAAAGPSELKDIPLVWKPTEAVSSMEAIDLTIFKNVKFTVMPFGDVRKDPSEIGKNIEKRDTNRELLVTTKDSVAAWMTERFINVLREFDLDAASSGGNLVLEGDVVKFFVTESSTYKAEVGLKIRLKTAEGKKLWEGLIATSASRFGSSYKAENYYEALSNATLDAVHALLKSDAFTQAVQKR